MPADFYEVLGVARDADQDTIKKAYRRLAMKYHPDKNPGDHEAEEMFKKAAEAYEVLGNPDKRTRYDQFGHAGVSGAGGFGGGGFQDINDIFGAFGDIFGDFFGGGGARRTTRNRPRRGADLRYFLEIDLQEVLRGAEKQIEFDVEDPCGTCNGSGAEPGSQPQTCTLCGGAGQVVRQQGFFSMATACPQCRGQGTVIKDPCKTCGGQGRVSVHRKVQINIPPGVETGTRLRVSGKGEAGTLGGPAGDLYVEIQVADHARFSRQDQNLIGHLDISYLQALLGVEMQADTLDGKKTVKVPPGTAHGDIVRVPGQGLPLLRTGRRGDLLYEVHVTIPKKLRKKEEELLRQIAQEKGVAVDSGSSGLFRRKK